MVASLPMYAVDAASFAAFWAALAEALRKRGLTNAPDLLTTPQDLDSHWRRSDLFLSQTCGYPLVTALAGHVRVVGAFRYAAAGCEGVRYRSVLIARRDDPGTGLGDFAGQRAAFNGRNSQSGYNSFRALVAPLSRNGRFFHATVETGAHAASMRAVAEGAADIAAIDCVSFALISSADRGLADALKIIGVTGSAPGLPLITRSTVNDAELVALRGALGEIAADPALGSMRTRMLIDGFEPLELADYAEIIDFEQAAVAAGYPDLS